MTNWIQRAEEKKAKNAARFRTIRNGIGLGALATVLALGAVKATDVAGTYIGENQAKITQRVESRMKELSDLESRQYTSRLSSEYLEAKWAAKELENQIYRELDRYDSSLDSNLSLVNLPEKDLKRFRKSLRNNGVRSEYEERYPN